MNSKEISALALATLLLLGLIFIEPFRFIDNLFYDLNFALSSRPAGGQVVVVAFDSKSLSAVGMWPWNRSQIAELIEKINVCNPRVIALDILLAKREGREHNEKLAMALKNVNQCVVPFRALAFSEQKPTQPLEIPPHLKRYRFLRLKNSDRLDQIHFYHATQFDAPDTLFSRHAHYSGFLNISTSTTSQKLREVIHVIKAGDEYFSSFALAAVAAYHELTPEQFMLDGEAKVWLGKNSIPISTHAASAFINFRQVPIVSAVDILNSSFKREILNDKLVFIGVVDPVESSDFFATPIGAQFAGVKVWANAALDIFDGAYIKDGGGIFGVLNYLLALFIFPGLAVLFSHRHRGLGVLLGLLVLASSLLAGHVLFRQYHYFWNPVHHLFAWLFSLIWLATRKMPAIPTVIEPLRLEAVDESDVEILPPPAEDGSPVPLPKTATTDHVLHTLAGEVATVVMRPGSPPGGPTSDRKPPATAPLPSTGEKAQLLQTIGGSRIVKVLGSGGMADVYLVWNPRMEVYRAVKVLKPDQPEAFQKRFETEIRIFSKLDHPNIVHCYAVGEWHSLPYVEMEFINGASLEEMLRKCGALSCEQAAIIALLICRALDYAHNLRLSIYGQTYNGIIHRDLKPANVMISRIGRVKLTDFGIARPLEVHLHTTDSANVVGTLPYLSPEQLDGQEIDAQADIYALGLTLYEMVTGVRAFPQKEVSALIGAKMQGKLSRPLVVSPELPRPLLDIIDAAIRPDKKERYANTRLLMADLERFLRDRLQKPGYLYLQEFVNRYWT